MARNTKSFARNNAIRDLLTANGYEAAKTYTNVYGANSNMRKKGYDARLKLYAIRRSALQTLQQHAVRLKYDVEVIPSAYGPNSLTVKFKA